MELSKEEIHLLLRAIDEKIYAITTRPTHDHETHRSIVKEYLTLEKKISSAARSAS